MTFPVSLFYLVFVINLKQNVFLHRSQGPQTSSYNCTVWDKTALFLFKKRPWECYGRNAGEFYFHSSVFVIKVIYLHLTPHHSISIYEIHFNFVVRSLTLTQSRAIKTFSESKECVLLFQEKSKSFTNLQTFRILLNYIENIINIYIYFLNIWKYEKLLWVFLHFRDR